jgi:hypothetical protein
MMKSKRNNHLSGYNTSLFYYRLTVLILPFLLGLVSLTSHHAETAIHGKGTSEKYLVLDTRIVNKIDNLHLVSGSVSKSGKNPLFSEEFFSEPPKRWEARYDNMYPSVVYDKPEKLFKLWYNCFVQDYGSENTPLAERPNNPYKTEKRRIGILYACSKDGIKWVKPSLGQIEYMGTKDNNIVMLDVEGGVLMDVHDPDPQRKFKMFIHNHKYASNNHMATAFSPDGITWSEPVDWKNFDTRGDTHNNAIWVPESNQYIGVSREWGRIANGKNFRYPVLTTSKDFINWSEPIPVFVMPDTIDQVYSMPIFKYGSVYLGLPAIFHTGEKLNNKTTCELAWSPDAIHWQRINEGVELIPLGSGTYPAGDYDCGCIYASCPVVRGDKIWIYYGGSNGNHNAFREGSLNLAILRLDGFAGYTVTDEAANGLLKTNSFVISGNTLRISADISGDGFINAALIDDAGHEIKGYGFEDFQTITQNVSDDEIKWKGKKISEFLDKKLRLQFQLKNATLYSISGSVTFAD